MPDLIRRRTVCGIGSATLAFVLLTAAPALSEGDPARGEQAFKKYAACHAMQPGEKKATGPNLFGVFGRKAASAPDYKFSEAMKKSGIVWDEATLDAYLTDPKKNMPGSKMAFPGLPKADERAGLIAYIKLKK